MQRTGNRPLLPDDDLPSRDLRRRYCHRCAAFLVPGRNMRVRVHRGYVVVTCGACNGKMRYRVGRRDAEAE